MKKFIRFLLALMVVSFTAKSQTGPFFYVAPISCYNPVSAYIASVAVTQTVFGASSYSWQVLSPSNCSATVSTQSGGMYGAIYYGCCGSHSIIVSAYSPSNTLMATNATVVTVGCAASPTISATANAICQGSYVILYASGASSYTWTNGSSNISYNYSVGVQPGTSACYTVTASNGSCYGSAVKCVTVYPNPVVTVTGNSSICLYDTLVMTASGATGYTWFPSGQTGTPVYVMPTTNTCYTVTGVSAQGCIGYGVKCVTVSSAPVISGPSSICSGSYAVLQATSGSNFTWMPGGSNSSSIVVSPSVATCYTLLSGGSGCSGAAVKCVSVIPSPTVAAVASATSICPGQNVTLAGAGATSYTWYPGNLVGAVVVVTPTVSTCYSVIGTTGGCSNVAGLCINVSSSNINVSGPSFVCAGNPVTLVASGASSYTWQPGGLTGSVVVVSPTANVCYTVLGSSSSGTCQSSGIKCITVGQPLNVTTSGGVFCQGSGGVLTAQGASSYTWIPFNQTGSSIVITPTVSGCYTVIGTSSAGCTGYATNCYSVLPTSTVVVSGPALICPGSSATLSASGANSYTWYPGGITGANLVVSPLASTCYTVTGGGCSMAAVKCVSVQLNNVTVSGQNFVCAGASIVLSATGSTSYTWQPGNLTGNTVTVSPSTTTCYTVTGSTGTCQANGAKCVSVVPLPVISTNGGTACAGSSVNLVASGAQSYTWFPFNVTGPNYNFAPTSSGCYTVTGTSSFGCVNSVTGCYSVVPMNTVSVSGNNFICPGGSATLSASGGQSYIWMPGGMSSANVVVSPSVSTCYTVHSLGLLCTTPAIYCVNVLSANLTINGSNFACPGSGVTLSASGAAGYTWQPGNLTGSVVVVSPVVPTCYTVTGSTGTCQASAVKCVSIAPAPVITTSVNGSTCSGQQGQITAQGAMSYTWYPFNLTGSAISTPSASACYTVAGTNTFGCTGSAVGCVTITPSPAVTVTGPSFLCTGQSATLSAGGAGSFTWLPGGLTGAGIVVSPTATTCYTVIGSNNGCSGSAVKCVQVGGAPNLSISGPSVVCTGNSVVLHATGASSYTWSTGANSPSIALTPTAGGCYSVTGSSGPGCTGTAVKCFSVIASVSLNITGTHTVCQGQLASIVVSGASSYLWNTGSTSSALFVNPSMTTVYTVTGSIGSCSQTRTVMVVVNPAPQLSVIASQSVICPGDSVVLTASGASSYTWSTGATGPVTVVTPTATTGYVVSAMSANGCSRSHTVMVIVSQCTGLSESGGVQTISMYPNPATTALTFTGPGKVTRFVIFDMLGKWQKYGTFSGTTTVDLSDLASGAYIVRLERGGETIHRRLIIER